MIVGHNSQRSIALMFTSLNFKNASEKVRKDLEAAVRTAMDEAQFLLMEDVTNDRDDLAKTKRDVALLLARRYAQGEG